MVELDVSQTTISDLTGGVEDYSVDTRQTDSVGEQDETYWDNAKAGQYLGYYKTIPELNHHLMEGLTYPAEIKDRLVFVFIESTLYSSQIVKRFAITKEIVEKNNIATVSIALTSDTVLNQVFELIQKGAYSSFFASMLYGIDPAPIPWVDYFKQALS